MHGVLLMPSFKKQRELIQGPNKIIVFIKQLSYILINLKHTQ